MKTKLWILTISIHMLFACGKKDGAVEAKATVVPVASYGLPDLDRSLVFESHDQYWLFFLGKKVDSGMLVL